MIAAALCAFATSAAAAGACETAGEKSSRAVRLDPKKDVLGYTTWAFAMDAVLNAPVLALATREVTCTRTAFQAAGETYTLGGENTELFPRRAIPATAGKPALFLVPVRDLSKQVSAGLGVEMRYEPGASYALIALDERTATAVRVYKKIPTDDVLVRDLQMVIEKGGQPFARMVRPNGEVAIVVSPSVD